MNYLSATLIGIGAALIGMATNAYFGTGGFGTTAGIMILTHDLWGCEQE